MAARRGGMRIESGLSQGGGAGWTLVRMGVVAVVDGPCDGFVMMVGS